MGLSQLINRFISIAFGVFVLLWVVNSSDAKCPSANGASLRFMTYNTAFQAPQPNIVYPQDPLFKIDDPSSSWKLTDVERVTRIVHKILIDDPDVIALQEVNKDAMKLEFQAQLQDKYPSNVWYVDDDDTDNDSGLMLFSKFKFTPLNNLNPDVQGDTAIVETTLEGEGLVDTEGDRTHTYGVIYTDHAYPDNWANKGAVIARIINECDGNRPFAVVATHTQASYSDHDSSDQAAENWDRQQQMKILMQMTESALTTGQMAREVAFLMGDLNIDGKNNGIHTNDEFFEAGNEGNVTVDHDYTEWERTFNGVAPSDDPALGFFSCNTQDITCTFSATNTDGTFFVDSWGFEMPPTDPGQTSSGATVGGNWLGLKPSEGARLDYVLHNKPAITVSGETRRLCLQYMKRGIEYFDDTKISPDSEEPTGEALSDHAPLLADFNFRAPRCGPWPRQDQDNDPTVPAGQKINPFGPQPVEWDLNDPNDKDVEFDGDDMSTQEHKDTRIAFPGSMQWYVIFQKTAWRLETEGDVRAIVYQTRDLSTPSPAFTGSCNNLIDPDTETAKKSCTYTGQDPPYYIRVFATLSDGLKPDRTKSDMPYKINFHRVDCSTKSEACPLDPGVTFEAQWPPQILNPNEEKPDNDTMFFSFVTEGSDANDFPAVNFHVEQSLQAAPNPLTMTLIDHISGPEEDIQIALNHSPTPTTWNTGKAMLFARDSSPADPASLPGRKFDDGKSLPKRYFFKVHRTSDENNLGTTGFPMQITYETDLTYLSPKTIQCFLERTWVGEDDIWLSVHPNSTSTSCSKNDDCFMLGDHFVSNDDGSASAAVGIFDGRLFKSYTNNVMVNFWEDVSDNDNFRLESADLDALPTNSPADLDAQKYHFKRVPTSISDESWEYELIYVRDHKKPRCAISGGSLSNYCPTSTSCTAQVDGTSECK